MENGKVTKKDDDWNATSFICCILCKAKHRENLLYMIKRYMVMDIFEVS